MTLVFEFEISVSIFIAGVPCHNAFKIKVDHFKNHAKRPAKFEAF